VVLTARDADGLAAGMTANSLASVSLSPPLVSVCVEHQSEMYQTMSRAGEFVINILSSHQETLSRRFAGGHRADRFEGLGYHQNPSGLVVLDGILAYIECARHAQYPLGDHTLFVGRVTGGDTRDGLPLLYYRGGYAGLSSS
jgi:flavin reductase (DIM6/NTAB) family NADH-FMN oxidoreductase RutF